MIIRNARVDGDLVDIEVSDSVISAIIPATGGFHSGDSDAAGNRVTAGLWDEHVHIRSWAQMLDRADLLPAEDPAAVVEILRAHPAHGSEPIIGHGLRYALWKESPRIADLDAVSKTSPVLAFSMDVHSVWVNSAAAERYGVQHLVGDSGILREADCFRLLSMMSDIPNVEMDALIDRAARDARAKGVVGITSFEMESLTDWDRRVANGFDIIKVTASLYPERIHEAYERSLHTNDVVAGPVSMGYLKVITDGAINTQTAYMHEPYCGTNVVGGLNTDETELVRLVREAAANGITPALHAIGDKANTVVINAFEAVGVSGRIEHAQMVRPDDVQRMAKLGITASIQPAHAVDDRDVADVLWCGRTDYAYPMRTFLDAGVHTIFGSDAPVAKLDPWHTIAMATNRSSDERPAWHPEEALTFEEALRCSQRGTVEVGEPADLIVLGANNEVRHVVSG